MTSDQPASSDSLDSDECRRRLAEAEASYRKALREHLMAVESGKDPEAIAEAELRKQTARLEYHRMLRVFSDLVVRGKRPKR
jgi:hypothetical protein